jgi:hypothetical protein
VLNRFFAVTTTSLYEVTSDNSGPTVTKIALRGRSDVGVGETLKNGTRLAICRMLQMFVPEGSGPTSPLSTWEPRIENVNTRYWGGHTSQIIALFENESDARICFGQKNLVPCDVRWLSYTKRVLELVGEDHPYIQICHWGDLALIPEIVPTS